MSNKPRARHQANKMRLPGKGSQLRRMMRLMIRPEGATTREISIELRGVPKTQGLISALIQQAVDYYYFDIRALPNLNKKDRPGTVVYKIVGRVRRNGGYRAFSFNQTFD
jgi:hypothetical protein